MHRVPVLTACLLRALVAGGLLLNGLDATIAAENSGTSDSSGDSNIALLARERQALLDVCGSKCHTLALFIDAPRSLDVWHETVQVMLDRGADGTDEQLQDIMDYLHQTVTTVNVNSADPAELEFVLDLSESQAQAIAQRRASSRFNTLDDLKSVPGLDAKVLDAKARLILYE